MESVEIRNEISQNNQRIDELRRQLKKLEEDENNARLLKSKLIDYRDYVSQKISGMRHVCDRSCEQTCHGVGSFVVYSDHIMNRFVTGMHELLSGYQYNKAISSTEEAIDIADKEHSRIVDSIFDCEHQIQCVQIQNENLNVDLQNTLIEERELEEAGYHE